MESSDFSCNGRMIHCDCEYAKKVFQMYEENNIPNISINFSVLKLVVQDDELKKLYQTKTKEHNEKIMKSEFYDSGFDIYVPDNISFEIHTNTVFINHQIKTEMLHYNYDYDSRYIHRIHSPFLLHPRSSITKTPLMLANHTGVIDQGYRGNIIGGFRNLNLHHPYFVDKHSRLLQICHPSLCPIFVFVVEENDLSNTERQANGFGSTGV
jgi:dUTP pyrophosphatase